MKQILIISFVAFLSCVNSYAKEKLSKEDKKVLKSVKKQYKLEDAYFVKYTPSFRYIELTTKEYMTMIADTTGRLIIPSVHAKDGGYHDIILDDGIFVAKRHIRKNETHYDFYSIDGTHLSDFNGVLTKERDGTAYIAFRNGMMGLVSKRGRILIPIDYSLVEPIAKGVYVVEQIQDGITLKGGFSILDERPDIPCKFHDVQLSSQGDSWLIRVHEFDSLEVFDPQKEYAYGYRDEGEKLYAQKDYEKARKYYVLEGSDAAWAQFFIGATYYHVARHNHEKAERELDELRNSSGYGGYDIADDIRICHSELSDNGEKALQALSLYLDGTDETYTKAARDMKYELSEMLLHIPSLQTQLDLALNSYEGRVARREIRERELQVQMAREREQRMEQQRINQEQQRINIARQHELNEKHKLDEQKRRDAERRKYEAAKRKQQAQRQTNQNQQGNQTRSAGQTGRTQGRSTNIGSPQTGRSQNSYSRQTNNGQSSQKDKEKEKKALNSKWQDTGTIPKPKKQVDN